MVPSLSDEVLPLIDTAPPSLTLMMPPTGQLSRATGGLLVQRMLTILSVLPVSVPSETVSRKVSVAPAVLLTSGAVNVAIEPLGFFDNVTVGEPPICVQL